MWLPSAAGAAWAADEVGPMMVEDAGEAIMAASYTMFTTPGLAYPGALVELNCATRGWLPIISEEASNCLTSW